MPRDKGKYNKRGGRGSRSFQVTSADEIEFRNARIAEWDERRAARRRCSEGDDDPTNRYSDDDHTEPTSNRMNLNLNTLNLQEDNDGLDDGFEDPFQDSNLSNLTRRQREQLEKERAEAEYRRRHALGLTEEYKRDMEKLAEVKKRREERAKAEQQKKVEEDSLSRMANQYHITEELMENHNEKSKTKEKKKKKDSFEKLDKITIKKMKPAQLKEALKGRGLDIQGNAKELTQRLLEYEIGSN